MGCEYAVALWKALDNLHGAHSKSRIDDTCTLIQITRKGSTSMEDYLKQNKAWADSLALVGEPYLENQLISSVTSDLDIEYLSIVLQIEARSSITQKKLQGILLAFENKREHLQNLSLNSSTKPTRSPISPNANFAKHPSTNNTGRGNYQNQGGGAQWRWCGSDVIMASSSADGRNMMPVNEQLYLEEEEVEALRVPVAREEEVAIDTRWCLVGKLLTGRVSDFNFYHEIDIQRVIEGSPWTYDRKPFIFTRLKEGDNPRLVGINHLDMWIQLHDLQSGNQTLSVVTALGNYIGQFLESDQNNFVGVWREYLRVRVRIDVRKPIKRRRKIITEHSSWYWPLHLHDKPYGLELRAPNQRRQSSFGAQWLRSGAVVREDGRRPSHDSSASPGSNPRPTNVEEIVGKTRQNHGINNPHFHGIIDSRNPSDGILGINGEDAALNVSNNGNFFDSDITTIVDSKRKRPDWDVDVVRDLFSPTDAAAILGIPISQSTYEDTWYWLTEQDGFYSVRSAYKLIQDQKFGSTPTEIGKFWKQMWAEKVPPKSKDFIWRAASKCLSTKTNLCIKKDLSA
ncbi:hypothetical protein F8388_004961 [Cannabis sativa]|uniref:Reverse transcriptase zinc-binding domain-containing protein n=1 Tax=Cannabis sativa TaxID=3483 RepID=A0A7J6HP29_CANSA|nr:hypothetical protein F8388_004961 [Cannabis sativa]